MSVLVGKPAPDFTAAAVMPDGEIVENFSLRDYLAGEQGKQFLNRRPIHRATSGNNCSLSGSGSGAISCRSSTESTR